MGVKQGHPRTRRLRRRKAPLPRKVVAKMKEARVRDSGSLVHLEARGRVETGLDRLPPPPTTPTMVMGGQEEKTRVDMVVGVFSPLIRLGIRGSGNWRRKKREGGAIGSEGREKKMIEGGWNPQEGKEKKRRGFEEKEKS